MSYARVEVPVGWMLGVKVGRLQIVSDGDSDELAAQAR